MSSTPTLQYLVVTNQDNYTHIEINLTDLSDASLRVGGLQKGLLNELTGVVEKSLHRYLIISLRRVTEADSSTLGLFLQVNRCVTRNKKRLIICNYSSKIKAMTKHTKLTKVIELAENEEAAQAKIIQS